MYGLTLVLALIITGGVIAYVGDHIGRKVGRRRLSMFGLRPKYTSIIITIITGIAVSTTTLVVLSIASEDVRTALFHMHEIQAALATSQKNLDLAELRLKQQQKELDEKAKLADELAGRINTLTSRIDQLTAETKVKAQELNVLTARNASLKNELEVVIQKRRQAEADLAVVRGELATLRQEYQRISQQYEATRGHYEEAKVKLASASEEIRRLEEQEARLQLTIKGLEQEKKRLEDETLSLETRIQDLTQGANALYSYLQGMSHYLQGLSLSDLTYRADEIILSTVIQGGRPLDEVQSDVVAFLVKANQLALEKGAKIEGSNTDAIIWFSDNLQNTYEQIRAARGKVVVRLVSATNAMVGQPVYAYLQVFENKRIFQKGEVIAKKTIDGSLGPDKVEDEMMSLLVEVNAVAIKKGMVSDAEGRVGKVADYAQFRAAKSEILNAKGPVEVSAVAAQDTWNTEGPLQVQLYVLPARASKADGTQPGGVEAPGRAGGPSQAGGNEIGNETRSGSSGTGTGK
ncbi:MAG TPA: DUF3084 domain-containing protein [Firmicutes bacterium]|nr:DUF3084 domain-containing protein [Bacillota bacterium]